MILKFLFNKKELRFTKKIILYKEKNYTFKNMNDFLTSPK